MLDDILTDERLNSVELADQMVFVRVLALLNHRDSKDGILHLTDHSGYLVARRHRRAYWEPALRRLDAAGLLRGSWDAEPMSVTVPNWAKLQGFAPVELRLLEESRVEENREPPIPPLVRESAKPPKRKPPPRPKREKSPFPPEGLSDDQKRELASSPSLKDITPSQFRHATDWARDWSAAGGKDTDRADWVAVIRNGINGGYALKGYGPGANGKALGRGNTNYTRPPPEFAPPDPDLTPIADLSDEDLAEVKRATAEARAKLGHRPQA